MFRIKTDIRQYKCETKDKVEKLIRNWVIRPTDLIYNTDEREWLPIGEHPSFMQLFGVLDEQERNTPDTVVTAESPYRSSGYVNGSDGPSVPVEREPDLDQREEDQQPVQIPDEEEENAEEVTHIVGIDDVEGAPASSGDEGAAVVEAEDSAGGDDSRRTDVFDQEDIARDLRASPHPAPPSAPEGLEPPVNDEVTTMTERTLEMLKITDEGDEVDRDAVSEGSDADDPNAEPSVIVEPQVAQDEVTDIRSKAEVRESSDPSVVADAEDAVDEVSLAESSAPTAATSERKPRLGRHDLPEELFATNEISAPEIREKLEMMDELGELSEPSENTDETTNKKPLKEKNGQEVTTRLHEDSGVNEAWDEIAEDVRATSEVSAADEEQEDDLEPLRQTDEFPAEDIEDDELLDDALEEEEEEEDEGEWDDDTSEPHIDPRDFVSDGYKIPLPYQVGPTPDDIRRGLKVSRASLARKDRVYPVPEPKKLDEIHRRVFDLTPVPPRDHTLLIVVVFFISIGIIVSLVSC